MNETELDWILPDWPAPARVRAATTTRSGGVSRAPYEALNLGLHVGDEAEAVAENRRRLRERGGLPAEPLWLNQVHGVNVVDAARSSGGVDADGSYSDRAGVVCTVMTADCLPLLLCDRQGGRVAALHAGWRGLADGVIEAGVAALERPATELLAWLGPAIGPEAFEVGEEVRQQFLAHDQAATAAFKPSPGGRWLADLYQLARLRLQSLGVTACYGGQWCTFSDRERFYSYRRDGVTGRMATLIWLDEGSDGV